MRTDRILLSAAALLAVGLATPAARAATEIQWWHAMGGANGERVNEIAAGFNKSQSDYKVTPVFKGNYTETMTAAIAAFRAGQQPHIVQVFEVGTATMMAAKGAVYPVYQLMADAGEPFDPKSYLQAVVGYYTTPDGQMLSMPFNSSTPVLWYNKTAFAKAGLDPKSAAQDLVGAGRGRQGDAGGGLSLRPYHGLAVLDPGREHERLAQPADRHARERLRGPRHRARVQPQRRRATPHRQPGRLAEDQDLRLRRSDQRRGAKILHPGLRDVHQVLGRLRRHQSQRQGFRLRGRHAAVLRRHQGRAPELDHRRRLALGSEGPPGRGLQRRREILHLSVLARGPGGLAPGDRLSADHHGRVRAVQGAGLLRQEPRHRHRDQADHPQPADRRIPKACASATSSRSATSSTRSWRRSGTAARAPRTRSTPRSSAATSCCASSRPTTPEARLVGAPGRAGAARPAIPAPPVCKSG